MSVEQSGAWDGRGTILTLINFKIVPHISQTPYSSTNMKKLTIHIQMAKIEYNGKKTPNLVPF